jgi:site-specific recombinase XerD
MSMSDMAELIESYLTGLRASGMAETTIQSRREMLRRADREMPCGVEAATTEELRTWLATPRWRPATRATYFHHLRSFYAWAADPRAPQLDFNPALTLRAPRRPRGVNRNVSPDIVADILRRAVDPFRTFALLAVAAGLRCCEIAGLYREDVTEAAITIRKAKGGDEQSVPTHPAIWAALRDLPAGLVTATVGGVPDAQWVSIRSAQYFVRKLGLRVSLHRLRHSYGTELRRAGHDLFVIQQLMRHASITSTQIYVEVGEGERRRAVNTLPIPTGHPQAA